MSSYKLTLKQQLNASSSFLFQICFLHMIPSCEEKIEFTKLSSKRSSLPSCQAKDRDDQVVKQKIESTKLSSKRSRLPSCQANASSYQVVKQKIELPSRQAKIEFTKLSSKRSNLRSCQAKIGLPSRQAKDRDDQVVKQKIEMTKSSSRVHEVTSETVELYVRFRLGAEGFCLVDKQKSWQSLTWKGRGEREGGEVGRVDWE